MEIQFSQVDIYSHRVATILLLLVAGIGSCTTSSVLSDVSGYRSNGGVDNPSIGEYISGAYFGKHDSLLDSDFENFIANELPLGSCEVLQDRLKSVPKLTILNKHLVGEGSHRRLSTSIRFEFHPGSKSEIPAHFCDAIIIERLPLGVFADPFELQHLVQRGVFKNAAAFGDTDLEVPSIRSNRSVVEVHMDIRPNVLSEVVNGLEFSIELPLHARYAPLEEHGFSRVEFSSPNLITRCSFDGQSQNQSCMFVSTENNGLDHNAVVWEVPCGMKEHTRIVSVVTFISAIVSALLIVLTATLHSDTKGVKILKQS